MRHLNRSGLWLGLALMAGSDGLAAQSAASASGVSPSALGGLEFRMVGPSRGGRVTAVAGVPSEPLTFYMGATGGGVWKTVNAGNTWENVSDGFFATPSIGDIAVAPSDPRILYVGTGSDGIRSNVIAGKGVYKSTDAGKTWRHAGLGAVGQIGAVLIHPTNPDVVYVAAVGQPFQPNAERGVYRTTDGGASWTRLLFVSDSTGAADLEFAPDNPREMYATMWRVERKPWTIISGALEGGVYKSTDAGDTWTKLGGGLPTGLFGKSDLAVSAADPARVYVLIEAPEGKGGVYRSNDRGATWSLVSTQASLLDRPFYYGNLDADPTNADRLFASATGFFISTDAGKTWQSRRTPHGDNHGVWINPRNPAIWVQANDGGANVTMDDGRSWSTQLNQPTAELYQIAVDDATPYWLYAGQQDNYSTIAVPSLPFLAGNVDHQAALWRTPGGCETGPAVPKPNDPNIVYSNCKGQFSRYDRRTGQEQVYWVGARDLYSQNPRDMRDRFQRVVPIHVSPHAPHPVYHASQYLYRTGDEGKTWERISPDLTANDPVGHVFSGAPITRDITGEEYYATIYAVQESKLERGAILVGANDGPVHVTRDGGKNWRKVTPPMPDGGRVQTVEWSPHRRGKAYVAVLRYQLGDWQPYLFRTTDYGATWTRLSTGSNGIPADFPTRVIREDPDREGLLYAGTEYGLFVSADDGATWQSFQRNLPVTPITDLVVHRKDLALSTMGRGFWIMDDLSPLHQGGSVAGAAQLFAPRDAVRMRYSSGFRDPGDAEFPSPGMYFDYYLASAPAGAVTLDVLDRSGKVLRQFSSEGPGQRTETPSEPTMRRVPPERVGTPRLGTTAGHHRVRWDFALPGPEGSGGRGRGASGPWVVPGGYQVRLTVGDWTATKPFSILPDPRVLASGVTQADLEQQLGLALAARELVNEVRALQADVAAARRAGSSAALDSLAAALTAEGGRYPTPRLAEQVSFLYRMMLQADQRMGRDAVDRLAELQGEVARARSALAAAAR